MFFRAAIDDNVTSNQFFPNVGAGFTTIVYFAPRCH